MRRFTMGGRSLSLFAAWMAVLTLMIAQPALSAVVNWLPQTSGAWDVATNWSGSMLPAANDDVFIDPTVAVNVSGSATHRTVKNMTIAGGGVGRVSLQLTGTGNGDLRVTEYSELFPNGELVLADGRIVSVGILQYNSGVIRGTGTVDAHLINYEAGQVRAAAGESLVISGGVANDGKLEAFGGSLEFIGEVTNKVEKGLITGHDATLRFPGKLIQEGSLAITGGVNDITGDIENKATGKIVISGGAAATFYDDVIQNGTLRVSKVGSTTGTAVFLGAFSGTGGSTGGGDIFFEGDLRPGNSPAIVTFQNNISLGSAAQLKIELGGLAPGTQHDQVNIIGQLAIDGTLQVSLINNFVPVAGNSFDILEWGSLSGKFDALTLPSLTAPLGWNTSALYTTGTLSVTPFVPGDFNRDGQVNAVDIPAMLSALTDLNSYKAINSLSDANLISIGDVDASGAVTNADAQALLTRLKSGGGSVASVPEPATAILLAVAIPVLLRATIRRRS